MNGLQTVFRPDWLLAAVFVMIGATSNNSAIKTGWDNFSRSFVVGIDTKGYSHRSTGESAGMTCPLTDPIVLSSGHLETKDSWDGLGQQKFADYLKKKSQGSCL
ncbi:hypothetical protein XENTR_v10009448 [Xenopus tropicalis]|nr:hypothetical protein XENTR_v10009448 [Xenopus tropicalis]